MVPLMCEVDLAISKKGDLTIKISTAQFIKAFTFSIGHQRQPCSHFDYSGNCFEAASEKKNVCPSIYVEK